ncbi:enhancing factor (viral) [Listeria grandensis]|uniref:Enhancing factor (Viral) n=1 Tax=Listeria grandensis TaxID=1494963 RepID=A0A7X0Y624_9LIST|nr:putative mucin/carbohydrate-binding domain-containing protein [Listeria grandensis]MBC1937707.1 enhancing factor (viral) [Listeria grandensis]
MYKNWSKILFVGVFLVVMMVFSGNSKAEAATFEKQMNTISNPTWLSKQGLSKGINHDRQDLGLVLSKNETIEIRQVNNAFSSNVRLELLNDDSKTESSYDIGSSWVKVTATADSVPFIQTTYTKEAPILEYKVSDSVTQLPVFKQGENEAAFFKKWDESDAKFGLISNKYIQILVPVGDKAYLKKMDDYTSIDDLLAYYDTMFETYNELEGLSFTPEKDTDRNIPNRYFAKADKSGGYSAYYGGTYTAESSSSVKSFWLKPGWGGLHEIGHGYQGTFMNDETFATWEVWNNLYADTMQKKVLGKDYYNGWLYEGNTRTAENAFENQVYTTKTPLNSWGVRNKLYMLTLMKDKAGDQAFTHFNQAYRAAANANTVPSPVLLDLLTKYFGEASHYDFTAFVELVQGSMSSKQKAENLYSGNKAVYPLASLVSGDNLRNARRDINLDTKWGLVNNDQLEKYKLSNTAKIEFSIDDFAQIKGSILRIKDGADVVREMKITSPTLTIKNMPVGIYSLDIPTGNTHFYEPSTNYLVVSDRENLANITMKKIETSEIAVQNMVFKGLENYIFATASVDPEKGMLDLNITYDKPHLYFSSEYASVEVLDENGNSTFKRVMNGISTQTGRFGATIKPGYTIKVMHKEASTRFSILKAPQNLVNGSTIQTFKVTKYGLASEVTGVTDQDTLTDYKEKLVAFAATISNNTLLKNEDYAGAKAKLKKAIQYLSDTDIDKIKFQNDYADLLAIKNNVTQNMLTGDKFRFLMRGLGNREFANLRINLETNQATITQLATEPHWYFRETYATIKINNAKGKEIFAKKFNGRGLAPASNNTVAIAVGDFITVTHLESAGRLITTNEETGERYSSHQSATYVVTKDGLKKVDATKIPTPNPNEFDGTNFQFSFTGLTERVFASMSLDLSTNQVVISQQAGEPNWCVLGTYASITIYDARGKQVYTKKFNGRGWIPSAQDNVKIGQGYYMTIMHQENTNRLNFTNADTKEVYKTTKQATYQVTTDGLLKVAEESIPTVTPNDIDGKLFGFTFYGLDNKNFATLELNQSTMELDFKQYAGKPNVNFTNKEVPYATLQVKDQEGRKVYSRAMVGNEDVGNVLKKIKLEEGYYVIIEHLESTDGLKMTVDNILQSPLAKQNVYQVSANGLVKKSIQDVPVPSRFTKEKIYSPNTVFTFKGLANAEFATLTLDRDTNTLSLNVKAVQPHYYFSDVYASIQVKNASGNVVFKKDFVGTATQTAISLDIMILEGYTIQVNHREPDRLVMTDVLTKETYTMKTENEFSLEKNGLLRD